MHWTTEVWNLKDLKEYAKNPRSLTKEQEGHLSQSIEKYGQCQPIVINTDGCIIGGHQRYRILKKKKDKTVSVIIPSRALTKKEVEELNIRLNKNSGEWDWDILANAWDMGDLLEWGFDLSDFDMDESSGSATEKNEKLPLKLLIEFDNDTDLIAAQKEIEPILHRYLGCSWKTKK